MSLKLVALFLSIAGVAGVAIGYYLRYLITLGKKGSMELEVKEMLLAAKEEAKKITAEEYAAALKLIQQPAGEMLVEIRDGKLCIEIEMQEPAPSASGKTLVVASSKGNVTTNCMVNGKAVVIGVNAYVKL